MPAPSPSRGELPIIQATMDLIQWFVPLLNRLPRDHRFALGDRLVHGLYDLLEGLVAARYANAKLEHLEPLNARLDLLRLQIRLLHTFQLIDDRRYEHVARLVEEVGRQLGGWISQQRRQGQDTGTRLSPGWPSSQPPCGISIPLAAEDRVDLGGDQPEIRGAPEASRDRFVVAQANAAAEEPPTGAVVVLAAEHPREQGPLVGDPLLRGGLKRGLGRLAFWADGQGPIGCGDPIPLADEGIQAGRIKGSSGVLRDGEGQGPGEVLACGCFLGGGCLGGGALGLGWIGGRLGLVGGGAAQGLGGVAGLRGYGA